MNKREQELIASLRDLSSTEAIRGSAKRVEERLRSRRRPELGARMERPVLPTLALIGLAASLATLFLRWPKESVTEESLSGSLVLYDQILSPDDEDFVDELGTDATVENAEGRAADPRTIDGLLDDYDAVLTSWNR